MAEDLVHKEIWKDIPGYEGYYQVSNLGRVKSLSRTIQGGNRHCRFDKKLPEKIMAHRIGSLGYSLVTFCKNGVMKHISRHNLVLTTFVGPRPTGYECAHLNGKPSDNRLENLIWATPKENNSHKIIHGTYCCGEQMPWAKLKRKDIKTIRSRREKGETYISIAKDYGVIDETIRHVIIGNTWKQA